MNVSTEIAHVYDVGLVHKIVAERECIGANFAFGQGKHGHFESEITKGSMSELKTENVQTKEIERKNSIEVLKFIDFLNKLCVVILDR